MLPRCCSMLSALLSLIILTVPTSHAEQYTTHHWYNQHLLMLLSSVPYTEVPGAVLSSHTH
jgi:hypothetical protein